ncbi:MAG: histidine phosphatase family protein [Planctomycetota bacterium]
MKTLVLVRHGATAWNASGYCQGHKDVALSDDGKRQVEFLANALSDYRFDRAVASPLLRARQTAQGIGYEPEILPDLIEIDRGHWEGHEPDEIKRRWGKLHKAWYDDPKGLSMPGGEAFDDLWARAARVAKELEDGPGDTVLACAHKAFNRVLVAYMTGLPSKGVWQIAQPQTGCNILVRENSLWRATKVGDVSHLPPELRSDS